MAALETGSVAATSAMVGKVGGDPPDSRGGWADAMTLMEGNRLWRVTLDLRQEILRRAHTCAREARYTGGHYSAVWMRCRLE